MKQKPIEWLKISHCENIYNTYSKLVKTMDLEPLPDFSHRYEGKLEAILESTKFKSDKLDYSLQESCACYFTHLAKSQTHFNGNKRMAVMYANLFLYLNGYKLTIPHEQLTTLALMISKDQTMTPQETEHALGEVFKEYITPINQK